MKDGGRESDKKMCHSGIKPVVEVKMIEAESQSEEMYNDSKLKDEVVKEKKTVSTQTDQVTESEKLEAYS